MPQVSLHTRLGGKKDEWSDRERELLAHVQANGLVSGVAFCQQQWQIGTSRSSLSEWRREFETFLSEQAAMDKLVRRRDRTRKLRPGIDEAEQLLSPENMALLDQRMFELQTALDRFDDLHADAFLEDDLGDVAEAQPSSEEASRAKRRREQLGAARAEIESRLKFFTDLFVKLSMSADMGARTKLAVEKFREAQRKAQDRALDALFEEIKGNNEAEQLFFKFRDSIKRANEEAA